jgi:SH3 domain protein
MLETGDEVEVVGEEQDYYRVALAGGRQGYVLKRYLVDGVPPERRLKLLEAKAREQTEELRRIRRENARLDAAVSRAQREAAEKRDLIERLRVERARLEGDERLRWFVAGAGVFFAGWLVGWTRLRLQRRGRRSGLTF